MWVNPGREDGLSGTQNSSGGASRDQPGQLVNSDKSSSTLLECNHKTDLSLKKFSVDFGVFEPLISS